MRGPSAASVPREKLPRGLRQGGKLPGMPAAEAARNLPASIESRGGVSLERIAAPGPHRRGVWACSRMKDLHRVIR